MNEKTLQTLKVKNEKLEKLCRALQSERNELGKKLKTVPWRGRGLVRDNACQVFNCTSTYYS